MPGWGRREWGVSNLGASSSVKQGNKLCICYSIVSVVNSNALCTQPLVKKVDLMLIVSSIIK